MLCLIVTDGEENFSRETTLEQVRTIIREREGRGDWTFAYLGAAPDRWAAATGMSAGSRGLLPGGASRLVRGCQRGDAPAPGQLSRKHEDVLRQGRAKLRARSAALAASSTVR